MPKLPLLPSHAILKALNKVGYVFERQKGSHLILVNAERHRIVVVPNRLEVPRGTLRAMIREAGLEPEEFMGLLD